VPLGYKWSNITNIYQKMRITNEKPKNMEQIVLFNVSKEDNL
jgi:hypothetical protein